MRNRSSRSKQSAATAAATMALKLSATHPAVSTPDARYVVVRGRLWRQSNPHLDPVARSHWVHTLMDARRAVKAALAAADAMQLKAARSSVQQAKEALGERGPVWWSDGTPDWNRHLAKNTPYAAWFSGWLAQNSIASNGDGKHPYEM